MLANQKYMYHRETLNLMPTTVNPHYTGHPRVFITHLGIGDRRILRLLCRIIWLNFTRSLKQLCSFIIILLLLYTILLLLQFLMKSLHPQDHHLLSIIPPESAIAGCDENGLISGFIPLPYISFKKKNFSLVLKRGNHAIHVVENQAVIACNLWKDPTLKIILLTNSASRICHSILVQLYAQGILKTLCCRQKCPLCFTE